MTSWVNDAVLVAPTREPPTRGPVEPAAERGGTLRCETELVGVEAPAGAMNEPMMLAPDISDNVRSAVAARRNSLRGFPNTAPCPQLAPRERIFKFPVTISHR